MSYDEFCSELDRLGYKRSAYKLYEQYECFEDMSIETFRANYTLERIENLYNNL